MIRKILEEIATPNSQYDIILDNILKPNYHLKNELISELAISFLEKEDKVNEVIKNGYFKFYFIRACVNNIKSNTSPFYRNNVVKERLLLDDIIIQEDSDIELKMDKERKYLMIDSEYVKIPKTFFQEFVWHEYFTQGKTYRQIAQENAMNYTIIFREVKKVKTELKNRLTQSN
jgi:hypothetical protein